MGLKVKKRGEFWWIYGTVAGQRIRRSTRTTCEEAARRIAAETEARRQKAALYGADQEATFADACVSYIKNGGETRFLKPILEHFKDSRLATIKPGHIRILARDLLPKASGATMNRQVITPCQAVINHAHGIGLCAPIKVKRFPVPKPERVAVDWQWIDEFREHAVNPYIRALGLFMFTTGARLTEALSIRPEHIDFASSAVRLTNTKSGEPRLCYLSDDMTIELKMLAPKRCRDRTLRVFGYANKQGGFYKDWRATCERAGIKYVPPHQAGRHSFATELAIRQGLNPKIVADLGGWKSTRLVMDTYSHTEDLAKIVRSAFSRPIGTSPPHGNVVNIKKDK